MRCTVFEALHVNVCERSTMALPVHSTPKPSSRAAPKLSRSQSLNLHDARSRPLRKAQQDSSGSQSSDTTDGARTLPPHRRKGTSDMKHEDPRHRPEFGAKMKSLFRRKSIKTSRESGIGASDVTGSGGLPVTASEEHRESGSGLPTQAVNLGFSRHLMTTFMFDQNKSDISRSSKDDSSHRSTRWYDGDDEETVMDDKLLCSDSQETLEPAPGENGQLMDEQEIKLLLESSLENGGGAKVGGLGGDSSPQSPSASQLFTISEECVEDDLSHHTSASLGASDSENVRASTLTPEVVLRRVVGFLGGNDLMNRWSIAGSGIHDSPSLRASLGQGAWHGAALKNPDAAAARRDSDSGEDSSKDEAGADDEESRTHGSSDSVLCDSVDLRMNTSQSMLELPRCVAEDAPRAGRGSGLRRSASLTLGRSQKLVSQVFYVLLN